MTGFLYRDKRSVSAVSGVANHTAVMADHFLYRTVLELTDNHEQRVFEGREGIQQFRSAANCGPPSAWLRNVPLAISHAGDPRAV
jgi:hypothetical protein